MFWGLKKLLMNREISMTRRLRLFDSTVTSCLLWCCESWTPRAAELRELVVARHRMLRRIVGQVRLPEEDYVAWIRRTTQLARAKAEAAGLRDWSHSHFQKKWSWAGHVARSDVMALLGGNVARLDMGTRGYRARVNQTEATFQEAVDEV